MVLGPVPDPIEDTAGVGDAEAGQGDVARRKPAPVDGSEVAVTYDGLPQGVDAVVWFFSRERVRWVRREKKWGGGVRRKFYRNVWRQCWCSSAPLCPEASRPRASNP